MNSIQSKYIFILQLPEDKNKNYIGILDNKYNYTSKQLIIKSTHLTLSIMKVLKRELFSIGLCSSTSVVLSNTISYEHPIFLFLSIIRKLIGFNLSTVQIEKAFSRITAYHISYKLKRQFKLYDYNKLYKKLLANGDCIWISKQEDAMLQNISRACYRIQKILRICMYYMCVKHYFLSKHH